jgi:BirA family biotin operon repressor/biotin-[acetyl-CoA-carboxylase] ligase
LNKIQPKTIFTGKKTVYLPSCHSTNDYLLEKIQKEEVEEGFLVYTDLQSKGKGQRGAQWHSEEGKNLMFTVLLKPGFLEITNQFRLNIAVTLGIYDSLAELNLSGLRIKWPNDIYIANKKVAGILIESLITRNKMVSALVGIGLNVNQKGFSDLPFATSLSIENKGIELDRWFLLESLCEKIENRYSELPQTDWLVLKKEFEQKLFRIDQWHLFKKDGEVFEGKIKGITHTGQLLIETKFGLNQFENKEFEYMI